MDENTQLSSLSRHARVSDSEFAVSALFSSLFANCFVAVIFWIVYIVFFLSGVVFTMKNMIEVFGMTDEGCEPA